MFVPLSNTLFGQIIAHLSMSCIYFWQYLVYTLKLICYLILNKLLSSLVKLVTKTGPQKLERHSRECLIRLLNILKGRVS